MAAVGSIVFSYRPNPPPLVGLVKITMAWLSDADGVVSGIKLPFITGELLGVEFVPDTGDTEPTDLYDVTLLDEHGVDVLAGVGIDLSHDVPTITTSIRHNPIANELELQVAGAGDANGGKVIVSFLNG